MKNNSEVTKSSAKHHCRTCLIKLNLEEGHTMDCELVSLLSKYIDNLFAYASPPPTTDYPTQICLACYDELQQIHSFVQKARRSSEKLYSIFNGISEEDSLLSKDTLMETETIMLDSSTTSFSVETEMNNPDPFSTNSEAATISRSANSGEDSFGDEENYYSNNENSNHSKESNPTISRTSNVKREEIFFISSEKPSTRSRVKQERKLVEEVVRKKKKRRTKKEMEQMRIKQFEQIELKSKRLQKGTKKSFKCEQCNHCFAHKMTLDAHVRKVHEGKKRPFSCDRCDKSYSFIGGLYTHIKEIHETEIRSYACDFPTCDRIYTSFIAMQKHKRLKHTDGIGEQKKFVCEQCGATFNQTGNLKYHRRTKHPTDDEKAEKEREKERYECIICKKLFHSRYTLKYHSLQLHTNDTKYECNVCGRRMAKKFMLVQHMLVHSTEKMPCEHCGKQFIRKFELEAHIKAVHMKLKPFECQYCSECFASRKTLRHHEYIHTGEKPYVCDQCGQAFRQQTCLKNHRKSHEKSGNYEAPLKMNSNRSDTSSTTGNGSQLEIMFKKSESTATMP